MAVNDSTVDPRPQRQNPAVERASSRAALRQNPAPGVHINLGQSNIVLLTVTTEKRDPWLANETARRLLHQTWSEAKAWLVGDYLLMPDHLHCFCAPHEGSDGVLYGVTEARGPFRLDRATSSRCIRTHPTKSGQIKRRRFVTSVTCVACKNLDCLSRSQGCTSFVGLYHSFSPA